MYLGNVLFSGLLDSIGGLRTLYLLQPGQHLLCGILITLVEKVSVLLPLAEDLSQALLQNVQRHFITVLEEIYVLIQTELNSFCLYKPKGKLVQEQIFLCQVSVRNGLSVIQYSN